MYPFDYFLKVWIKSMLSLWLVEALSCETSDFPTQASAALDARQTFETLQSTPFRQSTTLPGTLWHMSTADFAGKPDVHDAQIALSLNAGLIPKYWVRLH